jgi:hypothetical protein
VTFGAGVEQLLQVGGGLAQAQPVEAAQLGNHHQRQARQLSFWVAQPLQLIRVEAVKLVVVDRERIHQAGCQQAQGRVAIDHEQIGPQPSLVALADELHHPIFRAKPELGMGVRVQLLEPLATSSIRFWYPCLSSALMVSSLLAQIARYRTLGHSRPREQPPSRASRPLHRRRRVLAAGGGAMVGTRGPVGTG